MARTSPRRNNKGGTNPSNMENFPRLEIRPVPDTPLSISEPTGAAKANNDIKVATPDIILFDDGTVPPEIMANLIFEKIGGQELITVSRNDIVNGQNVVYQPIKNISQIALRYNSQSLIQLQNPANVFFENFPINFAKCIPNEGSGPNGNIVYIDANTGDLVVEVINLAKDEQVEVQVLSRGSVLDDTIYTEEES